MSTRSTAANLVQAVKDLNAEWNQTRVSWRDVKAVEFEKNILEKLPDRVAAALSAMEEIEGLLRKVHADCE